MKTRKCGKKQIAAGAVVVAAVAGLLSSRSSQADFVWQGGIGDYYLPNWQNGSALNQPGNNADINAEVNSGVVTISSTTPSINVFDFRAGDLAGSDGAIVQTGSTVTINTWLRLADGTGSTGTYTFTGGLLNSRSNVNVGDHDNGTGFMNVGGTAVWNVTAPFFGLGGSPGAKGYLTQTGGSINVTGASPVELGYYTNTSGTINISAGSLNMSNGADNALDIGAYAGGTGLMNVTGTGVVTATASELWIGNGGSGILNVNSGGSINVGNWIGIGRSGGTGVVNLGPGGTITKTTGGSDSASNVQTGSGVSFAGTNNVLQQTGGTFNASTSNVYLGEQGTSTWNMTGGSATIGQLIFARNSGTVGTLNLSGGVLATTQIEQITAAGSGTINFNGGTLQAASGAVGAFFSGITAANVLAGGLKIDTNGQSIVIGQPLLHGGSGVDGGLTKFGVGTLTITANNTYTGVTNINGGAVLVQSSTPFGPAGNNVSINAGGMIAITSDANYLNLVTLGYIERLNGGGYQLQNYDSNLSFVSGASGFTLGAASGTPSNLLHPISGSGPVIYGGTGQLNLPAGAIYSGGTTIVSGTISIPDDTALANTAPAFSTFGVGVVQFRSASTNFVFNSGPVNLGVASGATTVLNNPVGGSASLYFAGPGTLVLPQPLTFSGALNVSGGVLNFNGSVGSGPVYLADGTLQYATGTTAPVDLTAGRAFIADSGVDVIDTNGNNVTFTGPISGPVSNAYASSFTKAGNGTLTVTSTIVSRNLFVRGGTVTFTGAGSVMTSNSYTSIGQLPGDVGTLIMDNGASYNNNGDDFNVGDYGGTTPGTTDTGFAFIRSTDPGVGTTSITTGQFYVGKGTATTPYATGNVVQTGGTVITTALQIGTYGNGTYNITGGTVVSGTAANCVIGGQAAGSAAAASVGLLEVGGTGVVTYQTNILIGAYGTGTVQQSGGVINHVGDYLSIGRYPGGIGYYNISAGTLNDTANFVIVGEQGKGTLNVTGSGVINATKNMVIGVPDGTSSNGTVNQSGGKVITPTVFFGYQATAATPISATYALNGGTLVTGGFLQAQTSANVVGGVLLNGGTIQSSAGNTNFFHGVTDVVMQAGGMTFNTGSYLTTIPSVIVHDPQTGAPAMDGGLTVIGNGVLNLTAINTYTGATSISGSTLTGTGGVAGPLILVGTDFSPATLAPGNGLAGNIGAFTAGSTAFGVDTNLQIDLSGLTADRLIINGNLTLTGNTDYITFNGSPDGASTYVLVTYTGNESGIFTPIALPAGYAVSYSVPGQVLLIPASQVPEPATSSVIAAATITATTRRRRRGRAE